MSPGRKRSKLNNNDTFKMSEEGQNAASADLTDMGVGVLPSSDGEEDASDSEATNQASTDKSDESSMDSIIHKSPSAIKPSDTEMITPPEQILSFRMQKPARSHCKQDVFALLSDEIILMILQWLPRQCLSNCAVVCQRWRRITYDESLWQRIDLTGAVLQPDHMAHVLQRNPVILRMAQSEVITPMFIDLAQAMEGCVYQIQYLDLSMALISSFDLSQLLGKCIYLKKLSVEHCITNTDVCSSIAANSDLEVLNMSQCYQLDAAGLEEILINCSELVELNLAWTRLDCECIDIVCKLVNENVRELNLSGGLKHMKDSHVKELVSRCTCLTELDLSDCTELSDSCLDPIIKSLCDITELSFSRCYNTNLSAYIKLQKLKSLQFLNIFGLMHDRHLETFKDNFNKSLQINKHEFSTIARPTVGIRRTSIWGLRVRD